jgi:hypothetical protein
MAVKKRAVKKKSNPSVPKGKFIKCKAVKFNKNGSISIKVDKTSNPSKAKPKPIYYDPYKGKNYTVGRFGKRIYKRN